MIETIAYVYKWTNVTSGKWYIGCRTRIGCHPNDGYICSSKIVKPLILNNSEEWRREILFTGQPAEVLLEESRILRLLNASNDLNSFNLHNGDGKFTTAGMAMPADWRQKIAKALLGKKKTEKVPGNYARANAKKAIDPEYIKKLQKPKPNGFGEKISIALTGVSKSESHKKAMSTSKLGKATGPCSPERKAAIAAALKGKHTLPLRTCPHCGLTGRSNMNKWHFDNCRNKK